MATQTDIDALEVAIEGFIARYNALKEQIATQPPDDTATIQKLTQDVNAAT